MITRLHPQGRVARRTYCRLPIQNLAVNLFREVCDRIGSSWVPTGSISERDPFLERLGRQTIPLAAKNGIPKWDLPKTGPPFGAFGEPNYTASRQKQGPEMGSKSANTDILRTLIFGLLYTIIGLTLPEKPDNYL